MSNGRGKHKSRDKQRAKPCKPRGVHSAGTNGATRHPLNEVEKVLLGKGIFRSFKPIGSVR